MNAAHAVYVARAIESEARHVEQPRHRRRMRKLEEAFDRHAELTDEVAEVGDEHLMAKHVVTCGDRRVGGEDAARRDGLERDIEGQSAHEMLAQEFHNQKGRMTFVQVKYRRLKAQRAQRAHATDAQHDLLANTV